MKKILIGLLSASMILGTVPAIAKEGEESLKIDFDEKSFDYTEVNLTPFDNGVDGKCTWFNGGTSYIQLPDNITKGVSDYTFSVWLNMTGLEKGWQRIFDFGTGESNYVFFGIPSDTGNLRAAYKIGGGDEWSFDAEDVTVQNKWMHAALRQKGKTVTIYVNGKAVAEKECEYTLNDLGDTFNNFIGRSQFQGDPKLNAYADNIVFEKRALDEAEIAAMAVMSEKAATKDDLLNAIEQLFPQSEAVKENITLPDTVLGYNVTWTSSNEAIVNTNDIENGA